MRVLGHDPVALMKATWHGMSEDKVSVYAAQMAYSFFFALFPLLLFCTALLTLVADKQTVMRWLGGRVTATLPAGVSDLLRTTVEKVIFAKGAPGILSFGLVTAAWSGSSIFGAFRQALNDAYEVEERRPWWKQYALQLGALVVAGVVLLVATVVLLNGDGIMRWLGGHFGLGQVTTLVWSIVQFPLAIAAVVVLLWVLYLYLPDCRQQNPRYVLVGAITATVLWIAATLLFRIYVQKFNALNPAYGAIGAIMVLLTWMYYSSYVLLAAGELNSQLERGTGAAAATRGAHHAAGADHAQAHAVKHRASTAMHPENSVVESDGQRRPVASVRPVLGRGTDRDSGGRYRGVHLPATRPSSRDGHAARTDGDDRDTRGGCAMDERPADVEREIRLTRERMADTIAEIEDRVSEEAGAVKQKLNLLQLAADHPWPALAAAFAGGLLLSATGADRKAVRGAGEAAKRVGSAAGEAAREAGPMLGDALDRVKGSLGGESDASTSSAPEKPGAVRRTLDRAASALGVDEMRTELERGAMLE